MYESKAKRDCIKKLTFLLLSHLKLEVLCFVKDCSIKHDELFFACGNNVVHVSMMALSCNNLSTLEHDGRRRFFLAPKFYLV